MRKIRRSTLALALGLAGAAAIADDIRPEARQQSEAVPMADERCIEKCDTQSDQCMQSAEGDAGKLQACDDKYSECLKACEGG